jgi:hypothetical protein
MSIFGGIHYLLVELLFLSHITGTVRAYKEKHRLIGSHRQNPNVAGWFNGFIIFLFLGIMAKGIIRGAKQIQLILVFTFWLVAFISYEFGAIIYKKTYSEYEK